MFVAAADVALVLARVGEGLVGARRGYFERVGGLLAIQLFHAAIQAARNGHDFVDTQAHLLSALGRPEEALDSFLRAAELGGPERILWYQEELAAKGYLDGEPTGLLDEATREAFEACVRDDCRLLADAG